MDHSNSDPKKPVTTGLDDVQKDDSSAGDRPTRFAITVKRVTNWTGNLLASAVVVMIALVAGSHLVSSFELQDELTDVPFNSEVANAWPMLESCALQFGDSNIELQRDSLYGDREEVVAFMQSKCREILQKNSQPAVQFGENESNLAIKLLKSPSAEPVEQEPGKWRIFHMEEPDVNSPLPLVIGVRDDVPLEVLSETAGERSASSSRLAVWGIALPGASVKNNTTDTTDGTLKTLTDNEAEAAPTEGQWTSFVGSTIVDDGLNRLKSGLLPKGARRTLAIAGSNGGSMIGFSGGELNLTRQFFDQLAIDRTWKTTHPWAESTGSWSVRYEPPQDSPARGIQVQLHVNHNQEPSAPMVRGVLIVQANESMDGESAAQGDQQRMKLTTQLISNSAGSRTTAEKK